MDTHVLYNTRTYYYCICMLIQYSNVRVLTFELTIKIRDSYIFCTFEKVASGFRSMSDKKSLKCSNLNITIEFQIKMRN